MSNNDKRVFVDIHVIQSLPPSCVNRDDTGSPKTAMYGGMRRARVSSQSWKHAMREMFKDHFDESEIGKRTRLCVEWITEEIICIDNSIDKEKAKNYAQDTINIASKDPKKPIIPKPKKAKKGEDKANENNDDSMVLLFLSPKQVEKIAGLAIEWIRTEEKPKKNTVDEILTQGQTVDIALFGRMVAKAPNIGVDASAQVAHAISTHKVENEYDFYTAMDDRSSEDQAGAGMIGTVEFNSSTLYRYATVAAHNLKTNLGDFGATAKAVKEFIRAFVCSMPTGKQNTFANGTLPYAIMVTLRLDQPINLVGAFEIPVKNSDGGYQKISTEIMAKHASNIYEQYSNVPEKAYITAIGNELAGLGEEVKFPELLEQIEKSVYNVLQGDGVKS